MKTFVRAVIKRLRAEAKRKREARNQRVKADYAKRVIEYAAENPDKVKLVWLGDEPRLFDISQHSNIKRYEDMRAFFPSEEQQAEEAFQRRTGFTMLTRIAKK
jgi:sulfatase maturation enzyme AslB (radical SAM superfamily)